MFGFGCLCPQNQFTESFTTGKLAKLELEHYYYQLVNWKKEEDSECHIQGRVRFHNAGNVLLKDLKVYLDIDDEAEFYDVDFWTPSSEGPDKKFIVGPAYLPAEHSSPWYVYYLKLHHNHGFPAKAQHFTGKIELAPHYLVQFASGGGFKSDFNGVIE